MDPRNNQEVFDFVVNALRKQGKKSHTKTPAGLNVCQYRGDGGCKCAAGHLIPDQDYDPSWEGYAVNPRASAKNEVTKYFLRQGFNLNLVDALQAAHDGLLVCDWESRFQQLAEGFDLVYTAA